MKTSIIIPVYNKREYTEMCLKSIQQNTAPWDYEVIIIDNGSYLPLTYSDVAELVQAESTIIHNKKNLGFPAAINLGVRVSECELLCILNNDTLLTPGWLEHLRYYIEADILDVVGPITNSISGPQEVNTAVYNDEIELNIAASKLYEDNRGKSQRLHRLVGFCMLMKREVWDAAGPFLEEYSPGNFEDDDFCFTAIEKGFRLGFARDVFIHHFGSVSHDEIADYGALLRRNQKIFEARWPTERRVELMNKNQE